MTLRAIMPPTTPPTKNAPGALGTLQSFLNTAHTTNGRIDTPEQLRGWLTRHSLIQDGSFIDEDAWRDALELRRDLGHFLRASRKQPCPPEVLARLNDPLEWRFDVQLEADGRITQTPLLRDKWPGVRQRLLHLVITAVGSHEWKRLRFCDNDVCPWVFYDSTTNRKGRWCRPRCGNVVIQRQRRRLL